MSGRERLDGLFGDLIVRLLAARAAPGPVLEARIRASVTGLLDSQIIIEDPLDPFRPLAPVNVRQALPSPDVHSAIDDVIAAVGREGFAPHFHSLVGLLGALMIANTASPAQQAAVDGWVEAGNRGAFLMTDRGGATLDQWRSTVTAEADGHGLRLDKIWAINAETFGFATAMVRKAGSMAPVAYLLSPEQCAALARAPQGPAFLGGTLQLGSVEGFVAASPADVLSGGGPLGVSRFLCQARPRFVLGVMAHVRWLAEEGRIAGDGRELADFVALAALAREIIDENVLTRHSIDEVLALKFAVNETLLSLVRTDPDIGRHDQRDLLAFSKMEGSSYHCLAEIYGRCKGSRGG